ncbi:MAG: 4Fe-4S dicluster domain-containing protein [Candidatus Heimdallarchaeota archaeon]
MQKILYVEPEKCTGCRICESICSLYNENVINPALSRIHILKMYTDRVFLPIFCHQCAPAPCQDACHKREAISRDENTQALIIDYELCVNCKLCVRECPFGAVAITSVKGKKKIIKCDLCGGDPQCVKSCEPQALLYIDGDRIIQRKRQVAAKNFPTLVAKHLPS